MSLPFQIGCSLGYDNFRECVVAEFEQSQAHLYRLLNAAQIERNISPKGENEEPIPGDVLRPLANLEPEQQREAWKAATEAIQPDRRQRWRFSCLP